jgi:2-polyprenyl-6-methoxyphenol hydroxylase-like FAD-dependent oxidoreductase
MPPAADQEPAQIVISGAGIVGLTLALALKKHVGVTAELYEKAHAFQDDVGAALGVYPNGMRVLRDIDPSLLQTIKDSGYPYVYRRWERHDGTEIATAEEDLLAAGDKDLCSLGIRRWRLQKALYDAVVAAGIPIHFAKATSQVIEQDDGLIEVVFEDGTRRLTKILFGSDGGKSRIREIVADPSAQLKYTGITCLMGISDRPTQRRGISFPSSTTTECHSVYFPTGENEQCFQIHVQIPEEEADQLNWGNMSNAVGKEECGKIAKLLEKDGWHERYIDPLYKVTHAVRVGFCLLSPSLREWVYGKSRRIVLVGDAAHPPAPYVGQGAQMGIEDAGTIALLMKNLCVDRDGDLDLATFGDAMKIYEELRIPRTDKISECSKALGDMQEKITHACTAEMQEVMLKGEIMMTGNLMLMFPGATYNYRRDVMEAIRGEMVKRDSHEDFSGIMPEGELLLNKGLSVQ